MGTELAVMNSGGLALNSLSEIKEAAAMVAASGLTPKGMERPETICTAILFGKELGLGVMAALQNIAVINGRPSLWGDAMLGIAEGTGQLEDITETIEGSGDNQVAVCTVKRRGRSPHTVRFSVADAKRAGLWGKQGPWTQYPQRMMQMRARGFALRDTFASALKGIALAEEAMDEDVIDVTPTEPEAPKMTTDAAQRALRNAIRQEAEALGWSDDVLAERAMAEFGDAPSTMSAAALAKCLAWIRDARPEDAPDDAPEPEPQDEPAPEASAQSEKLPLYWQHPKVTAAFEALEYNQIDEVMAWLRATKPTMTAFIAGCERVMRGEEL